MKLRQRARLALAVVATMPLTVYSQEAVGVPTLSAGCVAATAAGLVVISSPECIRAAANPAEQAKMRALAREALRKREAELRKPPVDTHRALIDLGDKVLFESPPRWGSGGR